MSKLTLSTIKMFKSWESWEELKKQYPRHSDELFIKLILKISSSVYYRKRKSYRDKQHLLPLYEQYKKDFPEQFNSITI